MEGTQILWDLGAHFHRNSLTDPNPKNHGASWVTLWLFNIAMGNGPFIDGLPINSMVIFHGYVSHNQMVDEHELWYYNSIHYIDRYW